jgi:hypothetical protein
LLGVKRPITLEQRFVAFFGHGMSQLKVASSTRQPRFLQQERIPLSECSQFFPISVDLLHSDSRRLQIVRLIGAR